MRFYPQLLALAVVFITVFTESASAESPMSSVFLNGFSQHSKIPLENREYQRLFSQLQIRQAIINRAEEYIAQPRGYQSQTARSAFAIEGLLKFGFSVRDPYITNKIGQLKSQMSPDGIVYDSEGYVLHLETSYIHRALRLFSEKQNQNPSSALHGSKLEDFLSDEINQTQTAIAAGLNAQAKAFLQDGFAIPTEADLRAALLPNLPKNDGLCAAISNWSDGYVVILNSENPQDNTPLFPGTDNISAISTSSCGVKNQTDAQALAVKQTGFNIYNCSLLFCNRIENIPAQFLGCVILRI